FLSLEKSKTSICLLHVRLLHVAVVTGRQLASNFVAGVKLSRLRPPFKYDQTLIQTALRRACTPTLQEIYAGKKNIERRSKSDRSSNLGRTESRKNLLSHRVSYGNRSCVHSVESN